MAARQVIFTVCDLVQPVWQQQGPIGRGEWKMGTPSQPVIRWPAPDYEQWAGAFPLHPLGLPGATPCASPGAMAMNLLLPLLDTCPFAVSSPGPAFLQIVKYLSSLPSIFLFSFILLTFPQRVPPWLFKICVFPVEDSSEIHQWSYSVSHMDIGSPA